MSARAVPTATVRDARSQVIAILPVALFVVIAILLGIGPGLNPRLVPSPLVGRAAPQFSLPELHEPARSVMLGDLTEAVSLFNVFASRCVACRDEHPLPMALERDGSVPVFGLNDKDERDDAIGWLADLGDPYRATAVDRDGRVGIEWGVYGVPETFVVDRRGVIRYKHIGPLDEAALRDTVLPLVRELAHEAAAGSESVAR